MSGRRRPRIAAELTERNNGGFKIHRGAGDEDPEVAEFPFVWLSRLGRRQWNVDDSQSFERGQRMDERVFSRRALAAISGDRVDDVAQ
jgi:hypothetical protein